MSGSEIDGVRELLASLPRPANLAERRARLDTVASADGVAADIKFEPVAIGGCAAEWSLAPGSDASRVLLFFHGGGYCSGSIRSHRGMVSEAGRAAKVRTLALGYRLAPENPFPAALDDALAAIAFLQDQGIPASRIAIGGDSAGGGLSLATMIRLRDAGKPLPACAWLVSPWVDLEMTGASIDSKAAIDPLIHREYLQELAANYLHGQDPRNPLVSPLHADLAGLPPVLIQVGSAETLLDDAVRIAGAAGRRRRGDAPRNMATYDPRLASLVGPADVRAPGACVRRCICRGAPRRLSGRVTALSQLCVQAQQVAEKVRPECPGGRPQCRADDVGRHEMPPGHCNRAGDESVQLPQHDHEASRHDNERTPTPEQPFKFRQPGRRQAHDPAISPQQRPAAEMTNEIAGAVAEHGGDPCRQEQASHRHIAARHQHRPADQRAFARQRRAERLQIDDHKDRDEPILAHVGLDQRQGVVDKAHNVPSSFARASLRSVGSR